MPTDFAYPHQRRLTNKEDHPRSKSRGMNPKNERPRDGRMKQVLVDRPLEAGDHNRRQQQRHRKIKIAAQNPVTTGEGRRAQFFPRADCSPDALYVDSGHRRMGQDFNSSRPAHGSIHDECPASHLFRIRSNGEGCSINRRVPGAPFLRVLCARVGFHGRCFLPYWRWRYLPFAQDAKAWAPSDLETKGGRAGVLELTAVRHRGSRCGELCAQRWHM